MADRARGAWRREVRPPVVVGAVLGAAMAVVVVALVIGAVGGGGGAVDLTPDGTDYCAPGDYIQYIGWCSCDAGCDVEFDGFDLFMDGYTIDGQGGSKMLWGFATDDPESAGRYEVWAYCHGADDEEVCIVVVDGVEYGFNGTDDWQTAPPILQQGKIYVPTGQKVYFKALPDPSDAQWPSGKPDWFDEEQDPQGEGPIVHRTFSLASEDPQQPYEMWAECGNEDGIAVLACDLEAWQYEHPTQPDNWVGLSHDEVIHVPLGETVDFRAKFYHCADSSWMEGDITWECVGCTGSPTGAQNAVTFSSLSTPTTDYKTVKVTVPALELERRVKVVVYDIEVDTPATFPAYVAKGNALSLGCALTPSGITGGTFTWSKVTGPGSVSFDPDENTEDPTFSADATGTYTVEVDYTHGDFSHEDTSGEIHVGWATLTNPGEIEKGEEEEATVTVTPNTAGMCQHVTFGLGNEKRRKCAHCAHGGEAADIAELTDSTVTPTDNKITIKGNGNGLYNLYVQVAGFETDREADLPVATCVCGEKPTDAYWHGMHGYWGFSSAQ